MSTEKFGRCSVQIWVESLVVFIEVLYSRLEIFTAMKMEAARSSETLISYHVTTR